MGLTRKQRRQAQTTVPESLPDLSADNIPFAQPDRSGPKGKTLYDLAAEREAELVARADAINASRRSQASASSTSKSSKPSAQQTQAQADADSPEQDAQDDADVEQVLTSITYATTLSMLHFTLAVLVYHQYAQDHVPYSALAWRSVWPLWPILATLVYMSHTRTAKRWPLVRQAVFAGVSVASGCRLVRMGNVDAYLAVMRSAPPLGIMWVWSVVEMDAKWGAGSLVIVAAWALRKGYSFW